MDSERTKYARRSKIMGVPWWGWTIIGFIGFWSMLAAYFLISAAIFMSKDGL